LTQKFYLRNRVAPVTPTAGEKRYGFSLNCSKCKYRIKSGGILTLKKSYECYISSEKIHADFCNNPLTITQSYHATELGHTFVEQTTNQALVNQAAYVDVTGCALTDANLTDGKKYLIVVIGQGNSTGTNSEGYFRMVHGSTEFEGSEKGTEPMTSGSIRYPYFWYTVWTAVAGEAVKLQGHGSAATTVNIDQVSMVAIKLSDDLTENTDWAFNENLTDTTLAVAYATGNSATLTKSFNGTDDILVLALASLNPASITVPQKTRINASGGVTDTGVEWIQEAEDATDGQDTLLQTLVKVYTPTTSSTTFTTESESSSATGTRLYNSIFWLNLNKMKKHAFQATQAEISLDTTDTFATSTNVATASITPTVTGDVWCLGFCILDVAATGEYMRARIQVDNADQPGTQTSDNYQVNDAWDATDELPWAMQTMESLSNAAHTLDVDATKATNVRPVEDRLSMMVTMELNIPVLKTFTVDSIIQATLPKTFTLDSLILVTQTKTFTIDSLIQATQTKTLTVDSIIQATFNKTFTADSIIQATFTKDFTTDGLILVTQTKPFTLDSLILVTQTKAFTVDGIIEASGATTYTKDFTVDSIIQSQLTKTFTADSLILATQTKPLTIDSIILSTGNKNFTLDSLIKATFTKDFTIDSIIASQGTKTFTIDSIIRITQTKDFTIDSIISKTSNKTFSVDSLIQATKTKTFTLDSMIAVTQTKTFTIDAIIFTSKSFTVDSLIQKTMTKTFKIDARIILDPSLSVGPAHQTRMKQHSTHQIGKKQRSTHQQQ
jgi:hypothetical protein